MTEEAGKSQDHPKPRLIGRPSMGAKNVAITNTGQRNHQPNCAAIFVLLVAKERAQCISAPDVTWVCAWCLVSWKITKKVNL